MKRLLIIKNNGFCMKKYLFIVLLVGVWSCDKYEFIDKNTRFNKRTGEIETYTSDGWKNKREVQNFISDIIDDANIKKNQYVSLQSIFERMSKNSNARIPESIEEVKTLLNEHKIINKSVYETPSGLQYRIIKKGYGTSPSSNNAQVKVHYEGKLVDGTIFDSSFKKGEPFVTRLSRVIKGWTEGLQLMTVGSEFELFIHPKLAYGNRKNNNIPPNSILVFRVQLLEVYSD